MFGTLLRRCYHHGRAGVRHAATRPGRGRANSQDRAGPTGPAAGLGCTGRAQAKQTRGRRGGRPRTGGARPTNARDALKCRVKITTLLLRNTPMHGRHSTLALSLLATLLAPGLGFGQAGRAELLGQIQDPSGRSVPNAKVEAEDQATLASYGTKTGERGEYHLLGLPAGEYVL